ncbi:hypothetical protein [Bifidobacterium sp. UTBIF-78]|uniref:hypothetical protein n=1 Tax=Bifidobacterium sp. UTBIF-78 TaxID=1465263 RepID=UPI00112C8483|nr:hypothetical protein [Bifidobacterium sp. UTBIF-78]TPF93204.1 hypothetical protein BG22_07830 [Bifidobacterium sp. UTBIF-78]
MIELINRRENNENFQEDTEKGGCIRCVGHGGGWSCRVRFANGGASIIPKLTAVQGYDYEADKPAKLDNDGSVPFNWTGWDIKKIKLGGRNGALVGRFVYVTLTNKSKQDVDTGTINLIGYHDGKRNWKKIEEIKLELCRPTSNPADGEVHLMDRETIKAGETRTCAGDLTGDLTDNEPVSDEFRPWFMTWNSEKSDGTWVDGASCDKNNNKFDSCHFGLGTTQSIKLDK